MSKSAHRHWFVFFSVTLLFALPAAASHSWGNYHWGRTSNPFTLKLGDNVSSAWDSHLSVASSDWSAAKEFDTTIVAGGANPRNCRPTSGRIEVCNSTYGNNGWLGLAQIWASGSHITQAVTKLNDTYFNTSTYNKPEWRQFVTCQEIGHDFGLDHQDENFSNPNLGTCMDYTNSPSSNQHPNAHDYEQLSIIYAHTDSITTVGQSVGNALLPPPAMGYIDFSGPGQWGRKVAGSRNGGTSVYELDFGGGFKVFTFVTWTLEVANAGHDE